jgi:hypothetical protein
MEIQYLGKLNVALYLSKNDGIFSKQINIPYRSHMCPHYLSRERKEEDIRHCFGSLVPHVIK